MKRILLHPLGVVLLAALVLTGPAIFTNRDFQPVYLGAWAPWITEGDPAPARLENERADLDAPEKTFLALPEIVSAQKEIARGRVPLWNPFNRTGGPLLSHSLEGLLYPPHWILFLLPPGKAFALLALFSFFLAALFTWLLLRLWSLPKTAALGGALFFAFSCQVAANAHFFMRQDTLVLLPGLLWAFEAWRLGGKKRHLAALALFLAGTWTAGFPPFAYTSTLLLSAWALLAGVRTWRESGSPAAFRLLGWAGLAGLAGLLLAAPQLVPLAHYLPWSQRTLEAAGGDPRSWCADPATALTWIVPDLFGAPWTVRDVPYIQSPATWLLFLWSKEGVGLVTKYNFTENVLYIGAAPFFLALWGLSRPWKGKRGPLLALLLGILVLAFGLDGGLLSGILPGLRRACPDRLIPGAVLLLALFAARGLALLLEREFPPRRLILSAWVLVLVLGGLRLLLGTLGEETWSRWVLDVLAGRFRGPGGRIYTPAEIESLFLHKHILEASLRNLRSALGHGVLAWAAFLLPLSVMGLLLRRGKTLPLFFAPLLLLSMGLLDLLQPALRLCPSFPSLDPFSGTPLHKVLRSERARLETSGGVTLARVGPAGTEPDLFPADLPTAMGIRDLQVYAFVDRRTHLPMERAWKALSPGGPSILFRNGPWIGNLPDSPLLEHPVLDLYGVTHLLARRKPSHGHFREILERTGPGGSYILLERTPRPPRARVVSRAVPLDDELALKRISSPTFDPSKEAFLPPGSRPLEGGGGGKILFLSDRPDRVLLEIRRSGGGLLLLADTWAPGWSARVDGKEAPLLRADTCFRGVALPPGDHQVEFLLSKAPFRTGLLLFAAGGFLLLLLLAGPFLPGAAGKKGGMP